MAEGRWGWPRPVIRRRPHALRDKPAPLPGQGVERRKGRRRKSESRRRKAESEGPTAASLGRSSEGRQRATGENDVRSNARRRVFRMGGLGVP